MPIQLDDIASIGVTKGSEHTPKFFGSQLTGNGGAAAGLFSQRLRPGRYATGSDINTLPLDAPDKKVNSTNSGVTTSVHPFSTLTRASLIENRNNGITMAVPFEEDALELTEGRSAVPMEVRFDMTPQGALMYKDTNGSGTTTEFHVLYRMQVTVIEHGSASERVPLVSSRPMVGKEFSMLDWSYAPLDDAERLIADATYGLNPQGGSLYLDQDALAEWMGEYDVHERVSRLAEAWTGTGMAQDISRHIEELFANGTPANTVLNALATQLRYLETYGIALETYKQIHQSLETVCPEDIALMLSKQNLNLLMSHTLNHLEAMKPTLSAPPRSATAAHALPSHYSVQQKNAITTDEKLVLVQAGAGTGKSSVILGRIGHLIERGVTPSDITVLSFTNAAADNITAKTALMFPGSTEHVTSMTIARMVHDIYSLNHPTHELSDMDTILNSLDIFYPSDAMAAALRKHLVSVSKTKPGATTALNAFVEKYFDGVISILDGIGQTCLELEIIVAYQKIDTMAEPPHVKSRYLIIDEVQDNSILEFIYTLKYVAKHQENMYLVGDASQTLFEFRASNPRALNALATSGVFSTFQLTTNYRSRQEILDFANVHLAEIKANQDARLRLEANSLVMPTAASFQEKVKLEYRWVRSFKEYKNDYPTYLSTIAGEYVDACLARGEQVAFLMYSNAMVKTTHETLTKLYPKEDVMSLVSEKNYGTTAFSKFIKLFWNDVVQVPKTADAAYAVTKGIQDNMAAILDNKQDITKAGPAVMRNVSNWWIANSSTVNGWVAQEQAGRITRAQFFDRLRQNLLDHEIKHNSIKQSLTNQRNRERKEQNLASPAKLLVSTIHGAKGLEFDNVVVVHEYATSMAEDKKRLYYVAMTRAMCTMLVMSYGTLKSPRICSDYDLIVAALERRDQIEALRAQGIDPAILSEDEVEAALAAMAQDASPAEALAALVDASAPGAGAGTAPTEGEATTAVAIGGSEAAAGARGSAFGEGDDE